MTEVKHTDNGTVELPKGKIVGCAWQVIRKLGEGGCGSVYLVKNIEDDTEAAMKAESNAATGGCVLKLEVAILKKLAGKPHVCQFLFAARLTDFSYVIMTLLGESLNKLVKDLKPANMALGYRTNTDECRFFHVLDFGLARQYIISHSDQPSKLMMRRPRERSLFRGTTRYCSIRMHDRAEQGRVDDLWSMMYLLAELRGPLPWSSQNDKRVVGEMKRLHSDELVLNDSPIEFLEIAKHLRSLTYFNRPDYHKIFMILISVMQKGKFAWNDPFDWEVQPTRSKSRSASPPQHSREAVKKGVSKEATKTLSKENMSKEDVKTARKTSVEDGSREKMSKEKTSRERASNESAEKISLSAEKIEDENRKEYMKLLPFDPNFFASDPIGF
uniref:Protein kinase domain-containing protein n=1 Tax=Caenorhabditis tropicalis TaxID=1561998 RepID=A0A1I7U5F2_9PELO